MSDSLAHYWRECDDEKRRLIRDEKLQPHVARCEAILACRGLNHSKDSPNHGATQGKNGRKSTFASPNGERYGPGNFERFKG